MKPIIVLVFLFLFSFHLKAQVSFTVSSTTGVGASPRCLVSTDVNGDGKPDLITANLSAQTVTVVTNAGGGILATSGTYTVAASPNAVSAADLNGDGKLDLVTADFGSGGGTTITILTNGLSGGFTNFSTLASGALPISVTTADVNGDGLRDVISANANGHNLTIFTNSNNAAFLISSTPGMSSAPHCVTSADVNNDGKPDMITANRDVSQVNILTNNGTGGFTVASTYNVGTLPWWVTAADVNGDGLPDLITADSGANTLTILTNDGSGGFTISSSPAVGATPFSVAAADVNGDGWLDLVSANNGDNTLTILTNNGAGGFSLAATPTTGGGPASIVAADVNLDGKIDLIDANYSDNTVTILTNSTPFPPASLPIITIHPVSQTNLVGANTTFNVVARSITGLQLFNYQWRLAGTNLPTATNSILPLTNLALSHSGNYDVVVANSAGSVTSSPAILDVRSIWIKVNGQIASGTVFALGPVQITISSGYPNGFIYYTLDGSLPATNSILYSGSFALNSSAVLQATALSSNFSETAYSTPVNLVITPTYNLATSIVGSGTLTTNPPTGPYVSNSIVILTANPAARWAFDHWSGDATNSVNPLSITMNGPRNLQAIFVQTSFPVTVSSPGGGRVTTNGQTMIGTTFFPVGTVVSLSAIASNGWSFIRWAGPTNSSANPLNLTVTQTNSLQAIFGTTVTTNSLGGGIIMNLTNPIPFGTALTVSAVPEAGNYFFGWTGSIGGTNSPARIFVTNATPSIGALFSALPINKFSLTVTVVGNGFETNNPPRNYYNLNDVVTLRALTNGSDLFLGWAGDASGTNNPLTVTMNSNKVIQANFGLTPMVNLSPLTQTILAGSNTTITASAVGIPPLVYKWQNNFGLINGATNPLFTITNTQPTNAGNYFVVVTNLSGSVTSSVATVTVIGAPIITNQPSALTTLTVGHAANFNVGAYGWPALTYRWKLNGAAVNGATSNSYTLANAFPANAGNYTVVITNIYGSVTSTPSALTVLPLGVTTPRISAPGQFQFTFDTATGVNYTVQYSTNLTQWLPLFTVGGAGVPLTLTDPTTGIRYRFYRIMVGP
jgi:hypothetical protein